MTGPGEQLCQACALCCDGTLFTLVPLTAEDVVAPGTTLTVLTRENGSRALRQPCTALQGTCCGEYAQRPFACRRYECLLFEALRAGEVSLGGAMEVVQRAKALVADVRPSLADARLQASGAPEYQKAEAYLAFHFVGQRRAGTPPGSP